MSRGKIEGEARECISTHAPLTINPDQERIAAVAPPNLPRSEFALPSREQLIAELRYSARHDREQCGGIADEFPVRVVFGGYLQAVAGESHLQYYRLGESVQAYASAHGWPEMFRVLADAMERA